MALRERDHELAIAEEALAAAATGRGDALIVGGPPGIGRTALLDECCARRGPEFLVLRADAAAAERDFGFGVVQQLFQPLLAGGTPAELSHWLRGAAGLARRLLVDEPWSPGHVARETVLLGLHTLLVNVSEERPVLLVVDDLHWADGPSLRWLGYLARRLRDTGILVVGAVCDGRETAEHLLLGELAEAATHTLELAPLSPRAVQDEVAEELGADWPAETVRTCHTVTGGNPAALRVVLAGLYLAESRTPRPAELEPWLRDWRLTCVATAPTAVRDLADALAVLDTAAEPALLRELSGMDDLTYGSAMAALDRSGLLADTAVPRLVHSSVRDGVLATMSVQVRQRLHRVAARLLHDAGRPVEEVADLLLAAPGFGREEIAVLRAAAWAASDRGRVETAARYLRAALLDQPTDSPDRARLLVALGAAELRADPGSAARNVARAMSLLTPGPERAAAALSIPPALAATTPMLADAVRRAEADLATHDPGGRHRELAARLSARVRLLALHGAAGEPAVTDELGPDTVGVLIDTGADRELLAVLGYGAALGGHHPAAEVANLVERILAREQATSAHAHTVLPVLVPTAVATDSVAALADWLDLARGEARRTGSAGERALVDAEQAVVHAAIGRLGPAREAAVEVLATAGPDWPEAGALAFDALATVALRTQDGVLAGQLVAGGPLSGDPRSVAVHRMLRGMIDTLAGDWATARDRFLDCGQRLTRNGWTGAAGPPWRTWAVGAHRQLGDLGAAAALADEADRVARRWGSARAVGGALLLRASLTAGGDGLALAQDAVDVLRGSADRLELAAALTILGRRLRSAGRPSADPLAEGDRIAAECGVHWGADSSPCDGPVPRLPHSGHVPLTETEEEVVALVRRGWTNVRIADDLGVTRRAVEKTLTGVYRKLGVSGRGALLSTRTSVPDPPPANPATSEPHTGKTRSVALYESDSVDYSEFPSISSESISLDTDNTRVGRFMSTEISSNDPCEVAVRSLEADDGVFRTVFDRSGLRVAALDHKLRITDVTAEFATEFNRTHSDLRGFPVLELLHPSVRDQIGQQLTRLLEGQRPRFVERVLGTRSAGVAFGGELTGFAVQGAAGLVNGLLVVLRPEPADRGAVVVGQRKPLSEMDARILEGIASGASTVQLARMLYLSCGGVEYHLTTLLRSMKVGNRTALVSKAYSLGLFGVGTWPPRVLPDYVA